VATVSVASTREAKAALPSGLIGSVVVRPRLLALLTSKAARRPAPLHPQRRLALLETVSAKPRGDLDVGQRGAVPLAAAATGSRSKRRG
jgi:hypothetical protein